MKAKNPTTSVKPKPPPSLAEVRKSLAGVSRFYEFGQGSRANISSVRLTLNTLAAQAKKFRLSTEMMRRARVLAGAYDKSELEALLSLATKSRYLLGATVMTRLTAVPKWLAESDSGVAGARSGRQSRSSTTVRQLRPSRRS